MSEITFAHVAMLANLSHPQKHSLNEKGNLIGKRSCLRNVLGWVVHIITLGLVKRNGKLDAATQKIVQISQQILSAQASSEQKATTEKALRNLAIIIKGNSGSLGSKVEQLIKQFQQAIAKPVPGSLQSEIAKAQAYDRPLGIPQSGTWRAGPGKDEMEQTFEEHSKRTDFASIQKRRQLHIHALGTFSPIQLKILRIVADYLSIFHGVSVQFANQATSIENLKTRHIDWLMQTPNGYSRNYFEANFSQEPFVRGRQYDYNNVMTMVQEHLHPKNHEASSLCFMSDDLYAPGMNFIFGAASDIGGTCGLFSLNRLGHPEKSQKELKLCLTRLMKLASHEFGHMRGIQHCTTHVCNMQGGNSLPEMDSSPLLFCAKDMAKTCHVSSRSLKTAYQSQLHFFENFARKYGISCDFSQEITILKNRINNI